MCKKHKIGINQPIKTMCKMEKTMKFLSMAALALMGAVMTGCSSDSDELFSEPQQPENKDKVETLTTTVSFNDGVAATRALTEGGVKTFAVGDQIAVAYKNSQDEWVKAVSTALTADDITNGGKSAKFTVTVSNADKTKDVIYIYPASIADENGQEKMDALNVQDGSLTTLASNLDACKGIGAWNGENLPALALENQFTICKFKIKAGGSDITSSITQLTINDGNNTYTVTPTSSLNDIWVAIRPDESGKCTYKIYAAKGKELYTKTVSGKAFDMGKIYPINVTTTKVDGAISGQFTVNSSGKKVYFSQGNLKATTTDSWSTWTFSFMDYQYSTVETNANPYCTANYGDKTVVSLFGWGTSGYEHRYSYWQPYSTKNDLGYGAYYSAYYDLNQAGQNGKADWGYNAISNGGNTENSGWRTMTSDEWSYLLTNHTRGWATVDGVSGLVIRPYGVSTAVAASYDAETWAVEEATGAVFLPAAGVRVGNTDTQNRSYVISVGIKAFYWTATHYDNSGTHNAYRTDISSSGVTVTNNANPACGNAVRLVRDL